MKMYHVSFFVIDELPICYAGEFLIARRYGLPVQEANRHTNGDASCVFCVSDLCACDVRLAV